MKRDGERPGILICRPRPLKLQKSGQPGPAEFNGGPRKYAGAAASATSGLRPRANRARVWTTPGHFLSFGPFGGRVGLILRARWRGAVGDRLLPTMLDRVGTLLTFAIVVMAIAWMTTTIWAGAQ